MTEGDLDNVKAVVARKPELLFTKDAAGDTPLVIALAQEDWDAALWLVQHPSARGFVNEPGADGDPPLHLAARAQHTELVGALLSAGADANRKSARINEYTSGK